MIRKRAFTMVGGICLVLILTVLTLPSCAAPTLNWVLQSTEQTHEDFSTRTWDGCAEAVAQRTDGKFDIRVVLAKELGIDREDFAKAVAEGTLNMSYMLTAVLEGTLPQMGVFSLPYLTITKEDVLAVHEALYEDAVAAMEPLGFRPVSKGAFFMWFPQDVICSRPIEDFTDLDGFKIRIWRTLDGELIGAMGGEPIYMAGSECYVGLQRGVVDAVNTGVSGMYDRKLQEVASYYYPLSLPRGGCYLVINNDNWNDLPDDYKKILQEEADKAAQWYITNYEYELQVYRDKLISEGVQFMEIPAEGIAAWQAGAGPIWDEWAKADPRNQATLEKAKKALGL